MVAGCDAEIKRLDDRKARCKRGVETLRAAIEQAMVMADINTLSLPTKTLSVSQRAGKAIVHSEADIPSEFFDPQPPKLNKSKLTKAVKERTVPGASLSDGSISLTIRSA
jgi:formylmethanofuran dehydrogenase subunit A